MYTVSCAILGADGGRDRRRGSLHGEVHAGGPGDERDRHVTSEAPRPEQRAAPGGGCRRLDPGRLHAADDGGDRGGAGRVLQARRRRFANFGFDDDVNLDLAEYQIDALGLDLDLLGDQRGLVGQRRLGASRVSPGLSEGSHTVYFRVKDDAGNWNGEGRYSWSFVKDTMAPAPPTNFVALPGHNKVHLTWTNPTGDASFVGVEIRRVAWGDYRSTGRRPARATRRTTRTGLCVTQTALAGVRRQPAHASGHLLLRGVLVRLCGELLGGELDGARTGRRATGSGTSSRRPWATGSSTSWISRCSR